MSDNKMSGDQRMTVVVTATVAAGLLVFSLSIQSCYQRQDARIQEMVTGGADPIAAVCAIAPSTISDRSVCAIAAMKVSK